MVWLGSIFQDLRFSLRTMRKTPLVSAIAVLSLALGIGANTAIFTVLDALLLRSLPVKDARQIVVPSWTAKGTAHFLTSLSGTSNSDASGNQTSPSFSFPIYEKFRQRASTLSDVMAFADLENVSLTADGHAEIAKGQVVSGQLLQWTGRGSGNRPRIDRR